MNLLFLPMLVGHLVADFWFQPASWIESRRLHGWKSKYLLSHAILASVIPVLLTLQVKVWWFIPVIFVTHYSVDYLKSRTSDNLWAFLADQALHIGILFGLSAIVACQPFPDQLAKFWIYVAGFVLVTTPASILIGKFLQPITKTDNKPMKTDASVWIGIIERSLILIFIFAGQFQAIGFLVAAKSIFRFSEISKEGNPKAEYFLLGTLVSFLAALAVGFGVNYLLGS